MQPDEILEYRDKIIDAFKDGTFLSEYLKNPDGTGYEYVLKNVKKFTQEIESMSKKINLSLFEEFFESSSPANAKMLINTNPDEKKNSRGNKRQNIKLKRQNKGNEQKRRKNKNAGETVRIIKKTLDCNKNASKYFQLASKVDKRKSKPKMEEIIADGVKL